MGISDIFRQRERALLVCHSRFTLAPVTCNPELVAGLTGEGITNWTESGNVVAFKMVRPIAVGAMIVGAFYTLFRLRGALVTGIGKAIADMKASKGGKKSTLKRTDEYRIENVDSLSLS